MINDIIVPNALLLVEPVELFYEAVVAFGNVVLTSGGGSLDSSSLAVAINLHKACGYGGKVTTILVLVTNWRLPCHR